MTLEELVQAVQRDARIPSLRFEHATEHRIVVQQPRYWLSGPASLSVQIEADGTCGHTHRGVIGISRELHVGDPDETLAMLEHFASEMDHEIEKCREEQGI